MDTINREELLLLCCNRTSLEGCLVCFSDETSCTLCQDGIYGEVCDLICPKNCLSCLSEKNCLVCRNGFYGPTCSFPCQQGCVLFFFYNYPYFP